LALTALDDDRQAADRIGDGPLPRRGRGVGRGGEAHVKTVRTMSDSARAGHRDAVSLQAGHTVPRTSTSARWPAPSRIPPGTKPARSFVRIGDRQCTHGTTTAISRTDTAPVRALAASRSRREDAKAATAVDSDGADRRRNIQIAADTTRMYFSES